MDRLTSRWQNQLFVEDVTVGQEIPQVSIPLTLQRMVMAAGSNRDFMPLHHNRDAARDAGAEDVFANTFFIQGVFVRTLREWIGLRGVIKKISFQMRGFNLVGQTMTCRGRVTAIHRTESENLVELDIWHETEHGITTPGKAVVALPSREQAVKL